eukprot:1141174-Pelagomonas_calceolata.AAC.2
MLAHNWLTRSQVPIRFFIEDKFTDKAVLERLPPAFAQNPCARSRILRMEYLQAARGIPQAVSDGRKQLGAAVAEGKRERI